MGRGRPAHDVFLTDADRVLLEALVRQKTSPQRDVLRANIALMAHRGDSTQAIAAALKVSQQTTSTPIAPRSGWLPPAGGGDPGRDDCRVGRGIGAVLRSC